MNIRGRDGELRFKGELKAGKLEMDGLGKGSPVALGKLALCSGTMGFFVGHI